MLKKILLFTVLVSLLATSQAFAEEANQQDTPQLANLTDADLENMLIEINRSLTDMLKTSLLDGNLLNQEAVKLEKSLIELHSFMINNKDLRKHKANVIEQKQTIKALTEQVYQNLATVKEKVDTVQNTISHHGEYVRKLYEYFAKNDDTNSKLSAVETKKKLQILDTIYTDIAKFFNQVESYSNVITQTAQKLDSFSQSVIMYVDVTCNERKIQETCLFPASNIQNLLIQKSIIEKSNIAFLNAEQVLATNAINNNNELSKDTEFKKLSSELKNAMSSTSRNNVRTCHEIQKQSIRNENDGEIVIQEALTLKELGNPVHLEAGDKIWFDADFVKNQANRINVTYQKKDSLVKKQGSTSFEALLTYVSSDTSEDCSSLD